jgi:hypothetical protein
MPAPLQTTQGTIESTNDNGIKVNGIWLNRSKFRAFDLGGLRRGQYVVVEHTPDKNYIQNISVDGVPMQPDGGAPAQAPASPVGIRPEMRQKLLGDETRPAAAPPTMIRSTALEQAARTIAPLLAANPVSSMQAADVVIAVAARYEAWLLGEEDEAELAA